MDSDSGVVKRPSAPAGPNAQAHSDALVPRGARRSHDPHDELVIVRGEGVYVWDGEGRRYLDFVSGYSSTLFGHAHPQLVQVARDQLGVLTQVVGLRHPWRQELEARLAELAPMAAPKKVWLATTGARGVEVAWKLAFAYRPGRIVAFDLAYHGRSIATAELSNTARLPILPHPPVDRTLAYPQCQACPVGRDPTTCRAECFDQSEAWIDANAPKLSAIIVEPALGARGYFYAPAIFFQRLQAIARRHGVVLIDDEVQMGLGRLGTCFASQQQGWTPDLVILGKSLGGGIVPIAAVVGRAEIMDSLPNGFESETFAANPFACRIAIEALELLVGQQLAQRANRIGQWLARGLQSLPQPAAYRLQVASMGASAVIQVGQPVDMAHSPPHAAVDMRASLAGRWVASARDAGLLVQWSGPFRDRIVLIPPLIAEEPHVDQAFEILRKTMPLTMSPP